MKSDNAQELFPVVDPSGRVIGSATRGECHGGSMLLHPVVHLHLFNSRGELYLQRRPDWKDIQPGRWDTAVGGHVAYGETVEEALRREVREEIGVTEFTPERIGSTPFARSASTNWSTSTVPATTGRYVRVTNSTEAASGAARRSSVPWARGSSHPISRGRSGCSFRSGMPLPAR